MKKFGLLVLGVMSGACVQDGDSDPGGATSKTLSRIESSDAVPADSTPLEPDDRTHPPAGARRLATLPELSTADPSRPLRPYFVESVRGNYTWAAGDATPADGWVVVASRVATGNWRLLDHDLWLPAKETGEDDWENYRHAIDACTKHGVTLRLAATTYHVRSVPPGAAPNTPSGARVHGVPRRTRIVSHLADSGRGGGGFAMSVFYASSSVATGTRDHYLTSDTVIGAKTITVNELIPIGAVIGFTSNVNDNVVQQSIVRAVTGTRPNVILTLDAPVSYAFATSATAVVSERAVPTGIELFDLTITGTGDRAIELAMVRDAHIRNVDVAADAGTFTAFGISCDVGSVGCVFEDVSVDGGGEHRLHAGLGLESNQRSVIRHATVRNVGSDGGDVAVFLASSRDVTVSDTTIEHCNVGVNLSSSSPNGAESSGVKWTTLRNVKISGSSSYGIVIADGSSDITLHNVEVSGGGDHGIIVTPFFETPRRIALEDVTSTGNAKDGVLFAGVVEGRAHHLQTANNGRFGVEASGELVIDDFVSMDDVWGGMRVAGSSSVALDHFDLGVGPARTGYWTGVYLDSAGRTDLAHGVFRLSDMGITQGVACESSASTGVISLSDVRSIGKGFAGLDVGGAGDTTVVQLGRAVDFSICTYPILIMGLATQAPYDRKPKPEPTDSSPTHPAH